MKKKKLVRVIAIVAVSGILIAGAIGLYMFNMPHRDVQALKADFSLTSTQIVKEYLEDIQAANNKYLADDGDSKILEVTGTVKRISEDFNGQKVILLKEEGDKAGVSATFTTGTNQNVSNLQVGEKVTVKGVIRSGAAYDEDLGFYENVILEKSDIVKN